MSDVLDQNEVDALLAAIDGGDVDQEENDGDSIDIFTLSNYGETVPEWRPYDFKRPERVSKDQMRALEQLHEGFARNFSVLLSGFLRTIVEIEVANIDQLTYAEFTQGLPNPTSFNLLSCQPLNGQMCLEISPLIIYPIIDRLLGGSNQELFIPQRPLTSIEQRLVSQITGRAVEALAEAWESIQAINFQLEETESNPQLVQIVPPNEVVVVVSFEMKMSGRAGTMTLCVPFNVIESIMEKLTSQSWDAYKREGNQEVDLRSHLSDRLQRAPIQTTAILAETTIRFSDLVNMAEGDVIITEKAAHDPIVLAMEGKKKYLANIGQFKGKRAIKVIRPVNQNDRV